MRIANYIFAAVFALSLALQFNDPDPAVWVLIYGVAAAACLQYGRHERDWMLPLAVFAIAVAWAGYLAPEVIEHVTPRDFVESMDKKGGYAEIAREMGGLVIIAGWMIILVWRAKRRRG